MDQFQQFAERNGVTLSLTPISHRADSGVGFNEQKNASHFVAVLSIQEPGAKEPRTLWRGEYSLGSGHAESWARKNARYFSNYSAWGEGLGGQSMYDLLRNPLPPGKSWKPESHYWRAVLEVYGQHAAKQGTPRPTPRSPALRKVWPDVVPAADVLLSLQMEIQGADEPFADWVENFGMSSDSISAKKIWESVNDSRRAFRANMSAAVYNEFLELEE